MQTIITSNRLLLAKLSPEDVDFIYELVNSPGWLKFIGDRNVKTKEDARLLIQKIISNPNINYWIVRVREQLRPIGIVSFIKRDYLDHHDIGFAFLPQHSGQGYAQEAATSLLQNLAKENLYSKIVATTVKDNASSIALLKKLGFQFDKQIVADNEELLLYSILLDKFLIDQLTKSFFNIFTNLDNQSVNLSVIFDLCLYETIIIKKSIQKDEVYHLQTFIEPRQKILTDGTLTSFEEREVAEETKIIGRIAQRFSKYEKKGSFKGQDFKQQGNKIFQFVKTANGWKINAVVWEDDEN